MMLYESMLKEPIGTFAIIRTSQPNMWRLLHVTKESYKAADVDEHVIKLRAQDSGKKGFFVQGDERSEGGVPKVYANMQELVNDGGWMELKRRAEDRHYCKIAVCDTGNHRVQILGFINSTHEASSSGPVCLFPAKFTVLSVLGTGSKASQGSCHMNSPTSCAYNPHGDLVVADSGHWRVCIFAPDGEMVHTIGDRLSLQVRFSRSRREESKRRSAA